MGRSDSPADVQIARSFVAVIAALVVTSGVLCRTTGVPGLAHLPPEIRAVAMLLGAGTRALHGDH